MIRTPPLVAGAAALLWGWQTGNLPLALPLAIVIELPWRVPWRWELSQREFNRVSDFSALLFALLVVYQFNAVGMQGIYAILAFSPVVLSLLLTAQRYSTAESLRLSTLFVSLRRGADEPALPEDKAFDLGPAWIMVCLVAASTGERDMVFLPLAAVLVGALIWPQRPRRYPSGAWLALLLLAAVLGFGLQVGIREVQRTLEQTALVWLNRFVWSQPDPDHAATAIGAIGRLKMSDRIRLRVEPDGPLTEPLLLREASYDQFEFGNWKTSKQGFERVEPIGDTRAWRLAPGPTGRSATVQRVFREESGVVALPAGALAVRSEDFVEIQRNAYGTVLAEVAPGAVRWQVGWARGPAKQAPPRPADLLVPESYREGLTQALAEAAPEAADAAGYVIGIERFFAREFRYSPVLRGRWPGRRPLLQFLREDRRGHCEYFASATVLLLRSAGIPARYAVGYSVTEYSELEERYVARARHAHAWAEAWVDGGWRIVDTTPAQWAALETPAGNTLQRLLDLWSWGSFQFGRVRRGELDLQTELTWLLLPLAALLAWRLARRERRDRPGQRPAPPAPRQGGDSEFPLLIATLESRGLGPRPGEPLGAWLDRLASRHPEAIAAAEARRLLALHYRHRFATRPLPAGERAALRDGVLALHAALATDPHGNRG